MSQYNQEGTKDEISSNHDRESQKNYLNVGIEYVKQIPWTEHASKLTSYFSGPDFRQLDQNDEEYDAETAQLQIMHLKNKDDLLWFEFVNVEISMPHFGQPLQKKIYLILAYSNGFQIYEVNDPKNIQEVISNRISGKPVKFAKLLSKPSQQLIEEFENEDNGDVKSLIGKYPLLAVVYKEESNKIQFYSLKEHDYVHVLAFESDVNQIASNSHLLVVSDRDNISWFNPLTMRRTAFYNCYPAVQHEETEGNEKDSRSMPQLGVIALGQRWIAYPSNNVVTNKNFDYTQQSNQTIAEISMDVAKKFASTTYFLGDLGYKKVSAYMHHDTNNAEVKPTASVVKNIGKEAGTIELRDIKTKKLIAHFRAHTEPIAAMAFDPSGTLLVTVSVKGTYLNVYQIMPNHKGKVGSKDIRHMYRLLRGLTSARIHNIQFSINSKWVSICSGNGTSHLFAINPTGGSIDPIEFVSNLYDSNAKRSIDISSINDSLQEEKEPITLYSVNRLHGASCIFYNGQLVEPSSMSSSFYSTEKKLCETLLVVTSSGQYCNYCLEPFVREVEPTATSKIVQNVINVSHTNALEKQILLDLQVTLMSKQDVCRSQNQTSRQVQVNWDIIQPLYPTASDDESISSRWIANAEIETYRTPAMPLWMTGKFKFKIYGAEESNNDKSSRINRGYKASSETKEKIVDDLGKSVFIRITDPIPVRNNQTMIQPTENDANATIKTDRILKAIFTPMGQSASASDQQELSKKTNGKRNEWDLVEDIIPSVQSIGLTSKQQKAFDSEEEEEEVDQQAAQKTSIDGSSTMVVPFSDKVIDMSISDYFAQTTVNNNKEQNPSSHAVMQPMIKCEEESDIEEYTSVDTPITPLDPDKSMKPKSNPLSLSQLIVRDDYLTLDKIADDSVLNESFVTKLGTLSNAVSKLDVESKKSPEANNVMRPQSMVSGLLNNAPSPTRSQSPSTTIQNKSSLSASIMNANFDYLSPKKIESPAVDDIKRNDFESDDEDKEEKTARKELLASCLRGSLVDDNSRRHDSETSDSESDY